MIIGGVPVQDSWQSSLQNNGRAKAFEIKGSMTEEVQWEIDLNTGKIRQNAVN